jgi:hypothetical protein
VSMRTILRSAFHKQKPDWTLSVLANAAVSNRLAALGVQQPSPGKPTYKELSEESLHCWSQGHRWS